MAHRLSFTLVAHLLLLSFASLAILAAESVNKSEIDRQALLSFKAGISLDPLSVLRSWRDDSADFCRWRGVTCGKALPLRVISLDLNSLQLTGNLSSSLANLTSLAHLDLGNNLLSGGIPEDLGTLPVLEDLVLESNKLAGNIPRSLGTRSTSLSCVNLAYNVLGGGIPHSLATSSSLTVLNLTSNNLSGMIPASLFNGSSRLVVINLRRNFFAGRIPDFHNMATLQILNLAENNLSGSIPPPLGNVSSLNAIYLGLNYLGGSPPETLSQIRNLSVLMLGENNLSGHVPAQLYNISSLIFLYLGQNNLTGKIPFRIGNMLPNLEFLSMSDNRMIGSIPASLANTSMLHAIDLSDNSLVGPVPSLGSLSDLYMLNLGYNELESDDWTFLSSLTNCTQLEIVAMAGNNLNGSLPRLIGNLSASLEYLVFENNKIVGPIPLEVGKLASLIALELGQNQLVGTIPVAVQNLSNLQKLDMNQNLLSGRIPSTIAMLRPLVILNLSKNSLSGPIPSTMGNLSMLLELHLDNNNLSGNIPEKLGNCVALVTLNLSGNNLSGLIPSRLVAGTSQLVSLDLSRNNLNGSIPQSFSHLKSINVVDLSQNNFVGHIPEYFRNFTLLSLLDLSYNYFVGPIPTGGVFENATAVILDGNVGLCAKATTFSSLFLICPRISAGQTQKNYARLLLIGIPPITIALFSFVCFVVTLLLKKREHTAPCYKETMKKVSYNDILKATSWLSPINKISSSRTSSVYIGRFEFDTDTVAIKVFHLEEHGSLNSFLMECEVLRSTRHRNLMKAVTLCSTVDLENNEFKAIVFDFMANGNLDVWVHPKLQQNSPKRGLSLGQRMRIAMDVASALNYMHNQLTPPLVHCDLKPANVLLDYDMTARVGDFGSAKFLSLALGSPEDFAGVGGTIGYVAPEYGMGYKISTGCDVYSFGILLLELLTGKRPTDTMFTSGMTLHKLVSSAYPIGLHEVLDPYMPQRGNHAFATLQSYLIPLVEIALSCSMELPKDRPGMQDICARIFEISEAFLESW